MRLTGTPLELRSFAARSRTNRHFERFGLADLDRVFLPAPMDELVSSPVLGVHTFVEDDNRGAVRPDPVVTLDGQEFFLSVKGIGSSIDPYSWRPLDRWNAAELTVDPSLQQRLRSRPPSRSDRMITGERWLRGSPYGGQGLEHALIALQLSERADLTTLRGFRIAPVLKVCSLPADLEEQLRSIHWYRRYEGAMVQEIRLVPSNVRVYFHARTTLGAGARHLFDLFGVDSDPRALEFEVNYLASTVALLTLFARTLESRAGGTTYSGLDFHDVWLDKDAVLAPDGTVFFVDLEGIEEVTVERAAVREKLEDQVYRSLYEMTFGYEQIEAERQRRFQVRPDRRAHFATVLRRALRSDRFVRLRGSDHDLVFDIRNNADEPDLHLTFPAVQD